MSKSKKGLKGDFHAAKLPRHQSKTSKISIIRGLNVELEALRADAANFKKAIGQIADMMEYALKDVREEGLEGDDVESFEASIEILQKFIVGLKKCSEVTIA